MYRLKIKERAQKDLIKLAPVYRSKIAATIRELSNDPKPQSPVKLTNQEEWRIRQGDYRILYIIDDNSQVEMMLYISYVTQPSSSIYLPTLQS